jgi:hypothetical protein
VEKTTSERLIDMMQMSLQAKGQAIQQSSSNSIGHAAQDDAQLPLGTKRKASEYFRFQQHGRAPITCVVVDALLATGEFDGGILYRTAFATSQQSMDRNFNFTEEERKKIKVDLTAKLHFTFEGGPTYHSDAFCKLDQQQLLSFITDDKSVLITVSLVEKPVDKGSYDADSLL